jgi:hypothetical protein
MTAIENSLERAGSSPTSVGPLNLAELVQQHQATVWRYLRHLGAE